MGAINGLFVGFPNTQLRVYTSILTVWTDILELLFLRIGSG